METMTQLDLFTETTETVEITAPPTLDSLIGRGGALFAIIGQAALSRNWADEDWSKAWRAGYRSQEGPRIIPAAAQLAYLSYLSNSAANDAYRHAALLAAQALGVQMDRTAIHDAILEATTTMAEMIGSSSTEAAPLPGTTDRDMPYLD